MRDPRNWVRPVAAVAIGTAAGAGLVILRVRAHGKRRKPVQRAASWPSARCTRCAGSCPVADPIVAPARYARAAADGPRPARRRGPHAARASRRRGGLRARLRPPRDGGLLAGLPHDRARATRPRTSSRRRSSASGARARATTARAARCVRGCSASSTTARSTRCAASIVHDRRRASDEGIEERFEAPERTDVEVARREEARDVRAGARDAAAPSRAGSSSSPTSAASRTARSRRCSVTPIGTVKGRMRLGLREAARPARRVCRRHRDERLRPSRGRGRLRPAARCPTRSTRDFVAHLRDLRGLPPRGRRAARSRPTRLPLAAPQLAPPPELRERIMTVVRAEAELLDAPRRAPRPAAVGGGDRSRRSAPAAGDRAGLRRCSRSAWGRASCSRGGDEATTTSRQGDARGRAERDGRSSCATTTARACASAASPRPAPTASTRSGCSAAGHAPRRPATLFRPGADGTRRGRVGGDLEGVDQRARLARAARRLPRADERARRRRVRRLTGG